MQTCLDAVGMNEHAHIAAEWNYIVIFVVVGTTIARCWRIMHI